MIHAKKSLGQHFLRDSRYAARLANIFDPDTGNLVEVGPGKGMLTQFLVPVARHLLLLEKDTSLAAQMQEMWSDHAHVHAVEGDVLTFDFEAYFHGQPFSIAGNFPYNISSQILFRILDMYASVPQAAGMFQLEMARRIAAGPGSKDYGILSVLTAVRYSTRMLFTVPPGAFSPPPKVTSAVIHLVRKPDTGLPCQYSSLRTVVRSAFGQRRKMLRNSLHALFPHGALSDVRFQQRPEQLSLEEFIDIARYYESHSEI